MFINYSNHPSGSWADNQKSAALAEYGSITDVPFPVVPVIFTSEAVGQLAETEVRKLLKMLQESEDSQNAVMWQSLNGSVLKGLTAVSNPAESGCREGKLIFTGQRSPPVKIPAETYIGTQCLFMPAGAGRSAISGRPGKHNIGMHNIDMRNIERGRIIR